MNHDYVGREFRPAGSYEVSRVKIAEFADAIGDPNPVYRDDAAARAAGYPGVIAPPTFAVVISNAAALPVLAEPDLDLNYAMVVHREQRFEYTRQIVAGDVLTARVTITDIRQLGPAGLITARTEIFAAGGEHVCTASTVLAER